MAITERIQHLRTEMEKREMDAYMIPSDDYHQSEYVGNYFRAREYISGFTGSAGTVVVGLDWAGLWTDGRYFIQAEQQLTGSGIELFRAGEDGVPTIEEYLAEKLPENGCVGFDGRVIARSKGEELQKALSEKRIRLQYEEDLIDLIWTDRPAMSKHAVYLLDEKYAGESAASKLARVREAMKEAGAAMHLSASLEEIAWLYNLRGNDVAYTPVVLAYTLIRENDAVLFIDEDKLDAGIRAYLEELGVTVKAYDSVYEYVRMLDQAIGILLDPKHLNEMLYRSIPNTIPKIEADNPMILMKAKKNPVEIENTKNAYIKDGVACVKFLYWLKKNVASEHITEITAADKLEALRRQQDGCLDLSFSTIAGYQEHGAIVHYGATPETDKELKPEGMILVDSGGHYLEGTTDITRTVILGPVPEEQKIHYTAVLRSMLDLAMTKFLYGCTGAGLDIVAREPLWELDLDYRHGTGHGVGYLLSVHEGPTAFRWEKGGSPQNQPALEAGMIITDEPGVYIEGSHGIRIENQLVVKMGVKNEYGQFMEFENITKTPIDLDGVIPEMLTPKERNYLNQYHKNVYDTVSPFLNVEEKVWLKEYTREI
ncbi:MAG: aminopeptidase P family protein [Hespellia sp.]|nr:aminopeptidase P family protein [Hespellia sp.]